MGLLDKLKDIFSEPVEEDEPVRKEVSQIEIGIPKEEINISENETLRQEEKVKQKIYFDDEDFDTLERPKEKPRTYGFKENKKEEIKIFKPSPIISPVYGVLDKNYHKEDIRNKNKDNDQVSRSSMRVTVDDVRKKAFGTLEDEIENDLFKAEPFIMEEKEPIIETDLFDDLDFNMDGVLDEPKHEKKEPELDYVINIKKDTPLFDDLKEDAEELKELVKEANIDKDDLFDLIDSMYDKEEE